MTTSAAVRKRWTQRLAVRTRKAAEARVTRVAAEKAERGRRNDVAQARRVLARHKPVVLVAPNERAVKLALSHVGTIESAGKPNRGPKIDAWQTEHLGWAGFAWCGAFVGSLLKQVGVSGIVGKNIVYTPSIFADAKAGRNGFEKLVPLSSAKPGDLVLFNFPGGAHVDHVGMAIAPYDARTQTIATVEGNTSAGSAGSQSNGGGVFRRVRPASQIAGVARPRYAAT